MYKLANDIGAALIVIAIVAALTFEDWAPLMEHMK
jgi:hypothetical protein